MRPLSTQKQVDDLLERVAYAVDAQSLSLEVINPTTMTLQMTVQDKNRGFDWIGLRFQIDGVNDARLLDEAKLSLIDMSEGITATTKAIAVGKLKKDESAFSDATLFIVGESMKYEECEPIL